jgi:very-short-patch-repair endonuclease
MPNTEELLNTSRKELLDLSTRNRLLSIPVDSRSARILRVRDELSEQVFRLLVCEKKTFSFLPGRLSGAQAELGELGGEDNGNDEIGLPQPDEEQGPGAGLAKRHVDSRLQTVLSPEGLQRRLLDLYHDSRTMIEEQGVNILYLALGHLKWFEAEQADTARYAPLVLVPVELSRKTASEKFILKWTEDDIEENLSLENKLKQDFDIELPTFADEEEFDITEYFKAVQKAISGAKKWEVLPNEITLGFFSFAKFLMFRDLDPKNWPDPKHLLQQPFITGLLQGGFRQPDSPISDDSFLDDLVPVSRLDHVVDADSSQTQAIEAVRQGHSLVIQGPPGTGKSQSITNIISTAVLEGKRVLFVAEKLAALEVVKRRLEKEGLGALCLELHSNKSKKRTVIEEIGRTWKLGRPKASDLEALIPKLEEKRTALNRHARSLHEKHAASGLTPFTIMGHLSVLGERCPEAGDYRFVGAEDWTWEQRGSNRALVRELAQRIEQIGLPAQHPWRGVGLEAILQIDLDPLAKRVRQAATALENLRNTSKELAANLSQPIPTTLAQSEEQRIIAGFAVEAPKLDKQALLDDVWDSKLDALRDCIAEGQSFCAARKQGENRVVEQAWRKDSSDARTQIATHGQSLFRVFYRRYRAAVAEIRGILTSEFPKVHSERLNLIDTIIRGQGALRKLGEYDQIGQAAFGSFWRKERSDWEQLRLIHDWVERHTEAGLSSSFRNMFAGITDQSAVAKLVAQLTGQLLAARDTVPKLIGELAVDLKTAFSAEEVVQIPLQAISERLAVWQNTTEKLPGWTNYFVRARHARQQGLGTLVDALETGAVVTQDAIEAHDRGYYSQLLRHIVRLKPELAHFNGELHERQIADFRKLDRERLALAKYRTLLAHFERMPAVNTGVGAAGIVKGEIERKRGHRTVRRLLKDAGSVVQAIKPVFMMSPLSVAQFLEPGAVEFDLLVVDEASQVQPVDALGAIARCKQIVVVGDSKQLPPTRFFTRLTSNDEPDEDEDYEEPQIAEAKDIESILGLCRARGLPEQMLRWHYRSRHHSLIAVSNHEFYDGKLFIVPSPHANTPALGLKFQFVSGGIFDAGGSGTNRIEAKAVCRSVIEHARDHSELSLGVAAFSVRQRQAIIDELELLRRENPETESFFAAHPTEPFFIKNLENVQGDERDVIFISVGYGKNMNGYMAMRFGPLGIDGGERRLNVLISRAKKRCHVFTSISADDIVLERARGQGVASLKTFLSYAQSGKLSVATTSGREEDSPFEEAVHRAVESLGYQVDTQVGQAGFFIDLAVRHRQTEGLYLLGIECDGAAYHSSRSARDRDRLRQAVLEDHGWLIHRVWSTDWFQRPAEQLRKIAAALEKAQSTTEQPVRSEIPKKADAPDDIERDVAPDFKETSLADLATPYIEARFAVPTAQEPHAIDREVLAGIVLKIVQIEGPVHEDEVVNRVRDLWGYERAGSRIQAVVASAVRSLLVKGQCSREEGFLFLKGSPTPIRNRERVSSQDLRKPEMIPPAEIRAAILAVIDAGHGAGGTEIPIAVARMLGFKNTSAQLRQVIERQEGRLVRQNTIIEANGLFRRA